MHIEALRQYCLLKPEVTESFPFDNDTLVFKVAGKMFALISLEKPTTVNLKCEPTYALELREQYPEAVRPGWHMHKKYWNTVSLDQGLPGPFIRDLIDHSYAQVVAGLKRADRERLQQAEES